MEEIMYHTKLKKGDVGRYVFLPGDPFRTDLIDAVFNISKNELIGGIRDEIYERRD